MKIAIIGGGICGLTTALALQKQGIPYQVYEQAEQLNEVGAGIWVQPNALKVLDWIGIAEPIRKAGVALNTVDITNNKLRPIKASQLKIVNIEYQNISIHRGRLQKILAEAIPADTLKLGYKYVSHQSTLSGVKLHFEHTEETADLVLAADGIHSKVRKQLFPEASLRFSGQVCWRGIANINLAPEFQQVGREAWGKNVRFGFSQLSENEVYWFAVIPKNKELEELGLKPMLLKTYKDFHPLVASIIDNTEESKIIKGDLHDLKRLKTWHQDQICLMGDAAHATTPNMGQGACQGIEDAYFMSNLISLESDYRVVFERFEKIRRKKVDYVVNNSWRFGQMAHSTVGQQFLKLVMKATPSKIVDQQLAKLYQLDEPFNSR